MGAQQRVELGEEVVGDLGTGEVEDILAAAQGLGAVVDVAVTDPSARQVIQLGYVPVLNTLTLERLA